MKTFNVKFRVNRDEMVAIVAYLRISLDRYPGSKKELFDLVRSYLLINGSKSIKSIYSKIPDTQLEIYRDGARQIVGNLLKQEEINNEYL